MPTDWAQRTKLGSGHMETKTFLFTTSFYPPYHIGGDAIHVAYLSRELVARGHEVHVLHSVDAYRLKVKEKRASTEKNDGVHVHSCKSPFGRLSPLSAYAMGRSPYVEEISPEVAHHHNISLLGADALRNRDYRFRWVLSSLPGTRKSPNTADLLTAATFRAVPSRAGKVSL